MFTLAYPKKQTIAFSNILFKLYESAKSIPDEDVMFDLTQTELLTPVGIVLLTTTIKACQSRGKKCFYKAPNDPALKTFLTEAGFHKHFELDGYGQMPEFTIQSGHIHLQKRQGIAPALIDNLIEILDFHLHISPGLKGSLQMSLLEVMTNVVDHSGVEEYYFCSRNYPERRQIRLCMADMGKGIPCSLRAVIKGRINDSDMIVKATEEGVTTRSQSNGGMGLTHIMRFLKVNKGQLCIISGNGKVFWKFDQGKIQKQTMKTAYKGTIVKMVINTDKQAYYFLSGENDLF